MLFWVIVSVFIISFWLWLLVSCFGNTFETCYWLVLNVNSDDCSGCFSFVNLVVVVVVLFLNAFELILFSIFSFVSNILVSSFCFLFSSCACFCNYGVLLLEDNFSNGE